MIAQNLLGDAELWMDIATTNSLIYPYIDTSGRPGTVEPGDTIQIPGISDDETPTPDELEFGTDLKMNTDQINLTSLMGASLQVGDDGDYLLVTGVDCFRQDMAHRKITPVGTVPYHPEYGSYLPSLVGSKKDPNWKIKAQLEAERTMLCDPRVEEVISTEVSEVNTGVAIEQVVSVKGIKMTVGGVDDSEEI